MLHGGLAQANEHMQGAMQALTADVSASAAGSKAYTVPYTVTVKGTGPYTSVSPWEWSASVDAAGLVLPYPTACCMNTSCRC